jgi:hypothetical protein
MDLSKLLLKANIQTILQRILTNLMKTYEYYEFRLKSYHVIQGNGYTFSLQDENGHGLDRKYKYYELSKVTNVEKYLNRQADREKPLTNQQKINRREIEELLEHTVEPLQKKRKIISRNLFSWHLI